MGCEVPKVLYQRDFIHIYTAIDFYHYRVYSPCFTVVLQRYNSDGKRCVKGYAIAILLS